MAPGSPDTQNWTLPLLPLLSLTASFCLLSLFLIIQRNIMHAVLQEPVKKSGKFKDFTLGSDHRPPSPPRQKVWKLFDFFFGLTIYLIFNLMTLHNEKEDN